MTPNEKRDFLKKQKHKDGVNCEDWHRVHPNLIILCYDFAIECQKRNLPVCFTSIIRPMLPESKTDIHAQGRAADASVKGFTTDDIDEILKVLNDKYASTIGAISVTDGKARAIIAHNARGNHFHLQVRK